MSEPSRRCCLSKSRDSYNEIITKAFQSSSILSLQDKRTHIATHDKLTICGLTVKSIIDSDCLSDYGVGKRCKECFK